MARWSDRNIPDLSGRLAVVTGASSGLGFSSALALVAHGARIVMAVRDHDRGVIAAQRILTCCPGARVNICILDLADLASIARFASHACETFPAVDLVLNNAGLGLQPKRSTTSDGFERQLGTNHLGHFALTGRLMPALLRAPSPRVVTIASIAHRRGVLDFADLQSEHGYTGRKAYGQSKLANLVFALELDRRARDAGSPLRSVAAHPGVSSTGFIAATGMPAVMTRAATLAIRIFGQSAERGALPGLYAATMPEVIGGQYWGPDGLLEVRGSPALAKLAVQAQDRAVWKRLWQISESLTGVTYPPLA